MRIGIDAFPLAGRLAGIGRYVLEICRFLDNVMPEAEFLLYSPCALVVELPSPRWHVSVGGRRAPSSYRWLKTAVSGMARSDKIDIFWATRTILPGRTNSFRTVSTVHDLNYQMFPKSMPYATLWAHRLWFARDVGRADAVVANSLGTADRLRSMLGVEVRAVARPGVADAFRPQNSEDVANRLSTLGIRKPYFLSVGTLEPRKNLPALVEAFVLLKRLGKLPLECELLLVGSRGWRGHRLHALLGEAEMRGVRWLGFVPDPDLAALYAGALAFVFPSIYEGFGIPAAEARACGSQVVTTDMPELREASGSAGIYIPPTIEGICEGLLRVPRGGDTSEPSINWPSWREAASVMAEVFRNIT